LNAAVRHPSIVESRSPAAVPLTDEHLLRWRDEADTEAFALKLATCPALRHSQLHLLGQLGAGKTTLARYVLKALGVPGRIKSPTYAVVESYELPELALWHFDFYRFNDPREWEDAGFRDIFAAAGLKLVEWPQRAAAYLPQADLVVTITLCADESREVRLLAHTPTGQQLLAAVRGVDA